MNGLLPPELLTLLAEHFDATEATSSSLVCRAWNHAFCRVIWRHLPILSSPLDMHQPHEHLHQQQPAGSSKQATTAFWTSLAPCTHVHLYNLELTAEHTRALWDGCRNLQELDTNSIRLINITHFYGEAQGLNPHLKHLAFRVAYSTDAAAEALQLLTKRPNLAESSLACTWHAPRQALLSLIHVLEQGCLPQLNSLTLTDMVEDRGLAACLSAMTQARQLDFSRTHFDVLAFATLVPHFATLETLQWTKCAQVTGTMVQTVLASCPMLRVFCATQVQARLVQQGRPWVCVRMWRLVVCVVEDRGGQDGGADGACEQSRAVFGQLARLTALEELAIGGRIWLSRPWAPV
ncbi:hypothetical protein BGZ74_000408 [Mortierella antarctica]|nr:hypothetical protein BGZ74_000408 [Mortierella antarctica]